MKKCERQKHRNKWTWDPEECQRHRNSHRSIWDIKKKSDYDIMSFGFCINIKIQFSVPNKIKLIYKVFLIKHS